LDLPQLVEKLVVGVVGDLGVVEDVVAVAVVGELLPQLLRAVGDRAQSVTSSSGPRSSASRSYLRSSSMRRRAVRSKCSGVTAMRPAWTAARSVPGSSSWTREAPEIRFAFAPLAPS